MSDTALPTPRKAIIAGVEFLRTKNNNLLRRPVANVASTYATLEAQEVKDTANYFHRPASKPVAQCEHFIKNGISLRLHHPTIPDRLDHPTSSRHLLVSTLDHF